MGYYVSCMGYVTKLESFFQDCLVTDSVQTDIRFSFKRNECMMYDIQYFRGLGLLKENKP